jgi:hypothetical protein
VSWYSFRHTYFIRLKLLNLFTAILTCLHQHTYRLPLLWFLFLISPQPDVHPDALSGCIGRTSMQCLLFRTCLNMVLDWPLFTYRNIMCIHYKFWLIFSCVVFTVKCTISNDACSTYDVISSIDFISVNTTRTRPQFLRHCYI